MSTTAVAPKQTALQKIASLLNFGLEEEEHIAQKVPVLNTGKGGTILSLVFLGTEVADEFVTSLAAKQAAEATPAPAPVADPAPTA